MSAVLAALQDKAEELLGLLFNSQTPTVTAKAAKTETAKPIQNTTGHSVDVYIELEGKGAFTIKVLNPKKEATGLVLTYTLPAATNVTAAFRVPAGYWYEAEFAEGTAAEATFVTGA